MLTFDLCAFLTLLRKFYQIDSAKEYQKVYPQDWKIAFAPTRNIKKPKFEKKNEILFFGRSLLVPKRAFNSQDNFFQAEISYESEEDTL